MITSFKLFESSEEQDKSFYIEMIESYIQYTENDNIEVDSLGLIYKPKYSVYEGFENIIYDNNDNTEVMTWVELNI